jgi:hypothetical protein
MANPLRPQDDDTEDQQQPAAGGQNKLMRVLSDPGVSSALLGFGAGMLQPVGPGETQFGNVAKGLTGAGEAERLGQEHEQAGRKLDIAEQEAASKEQLRAAQAGTATERALRAGDLFELRQQQARETETTHTINEYMRHQQAIAATNKAIQAQNKANDDARMYGTGKKEEIPKNLPFQQPLPFAEWLQSVGRSVPSLGTPVSPTRPQQQQQQKPLTATDKADLERHLRDNPNEKERVRAWVQKNYGADAVSKIQGLAP